MRKFFGVLLILIMTFFHYDMSAQPYEPFFSAPTFGTQTDLPAVNPLIVLRQRLVTVQSTFLDGGGQTTLHLNPFDDIHLQAERKHTETNPSNHLVWFGQIGQEPSSDVVLVWDGSRMAGSITTPDRKYTVRHLSENLHLVREVDLTILRAVSSAPQATTLALQAVPAGFETDVLDLVNQERAAQNLHPLAWDSQLLEAARAHSEDMAQNNYFSHTSLDGRTVADRIEAAGYLWSGAGENIACGYSTPQAVVNGWMNSAGHRQNILSSTYCDLGVGYAYDPSSTYDHYWTQDFGRRLGVSTCPATANQAPSAGFMATPISGPSPLAVQFDGCASTDPEGGALSFNWDYGDGQTGSGESPSHTYGNAGVYTVTLTVTDSGGMADRLVKTNFITAVEPSPGQNALIIHIVGQGTATMTPAGGSYDPGATVTVTAIPTGGWEFSGWSGDLASSDNPVSIGMTFPRSLTATFTQVGNSGPVVSAASGSSGGGCFVSTMRPQ